MSLHGKLPRTGRLGAGRSRGMFDGVPVHGQPCGVGAGGCQPDGGGSITSLGAAPTTATGHHAGNALRDGSLWPRARPVQRARHRWRRTATARLAAAMRGDACSGLSRPWLLCTGLSTPGLFRARLCRTSAGLYRQLNRAAGLLRGRGGHGASAATAYRGLPALWRNPHRDHHAHGGCGRSPSAPGAATPSPAA